VSHQIQPYNRGQALGQRRAPSNFSASPRCPMCSSTDVRAFSAIYGFGTTNYLTSRGLFVSHAFQRTKRQTVLAANCRPPRKFPWWPAIVLLLIAGASHMAESILPRIFDLLEQGVYWMLWIALGLGMLAAVENHAFYPSRMAAWGRKLLCQRCGTSFDSLA